jgi:hypothetical protein
MHTIENNTFKFVFENEIDDEGRRIHTLDVWKAGEWYAHVSFDGGEAWELANYLTHGIVDNLVDELKVNDCHSQVWEPKAEDWVPCGTHGVECPACEYETAKIRGEA